MNPQRRCAHCRRRPSMKWIICMHRDSIGGRSQVLIPTIMATVSKTYPLKQGDRLTPVVLERTRSFIDRASRRTVNQVTVKKTVEMIREIKDIEMTKFPRMKWMRDGVGGIALISSSTQASAGPPPDLRVPAGVSEFASPGLRLTWSIGDGTSARMSM